MYQKNLIDRYILGRQPHNKFSSIKQKITLYTNYLNNTVIYTVSYAYNIVCDHENVYMWEKKQKKFCPKSENDKRFKGCDQRLIYMREKHA